MEVESLLEFITKLDLSDDAKTTLTLKIGRALREVCKSDSNRS